MEKVDYGYVNKVLMMIRRLPDGYSEGVYQHKTYGITKEVFNKGTSFKVYGRELGGTDVISLNYYNTTCKGYLKPCEMSEDKVVAFLKNVKLK